MSVGFFPRHGRIVGALMMRELITRYGREGLGFLWLIGEPLMFCLGVLLMWHVIKPDYEHGVRLGPFVMTGYMSLLLMRHQISYSLSAIQANIGLLHHRRITVLHLYLARNLLEFGGATGAFVIVYAFLAGLGQVSAPHDWLLLYSGWLLLGWLSMGLAVMLSALALRFDVMERVVPLLTYALIPVSGVFFMVSWIPAPYQDAYLLLPFPHPIEMIRAGVFGEFVATRYNAPYALGWAAVFNFAGLILLAGAKDHIDAE
tara:strand:+ start:371 stop:1147 length:777 start_codon:yes stop_codon:yes gene_type:complete